MRIGILTSGGDCPGLNAVIRGFAKYAYNNIKAVEIIGFADGYGGLINAEYKLMKPEDFSGILNVGGTILGTSRQPSKQMKVEENSTSKLEKMVDTYKKLQLDCLLTLGGAGTHKTALMLSQEGLNIIGLPKTIDNDIIGTDLTFGFHTAFDTASMCIDRIHTTAASHGRTMILEIMGNKSGWLTLYSGIASGADVILIPEIPFDYDIVCETIKRRALAGKDFTIICVAEGAYDIEEDKKKRKEWLSDRQAKGETTISNRLAQIISERCDVETRVVVPGHILRGGSPTPYDRLLSTQIGCMAGTLVKEGKFGITVAFVDNKVTYNKLSDVAKDVKLINLDHQMLKFAEDIGISLGRKKP